jgi:hypothetical protein
MDMDNTFLEQRDEVTEDNVTEDNYSGAQQPLGWNLSGQLTLHDSHILSYLTKETSKVTDHLVKGWSVRKTVVTGILVTILLHQLCTILIHALQVDRIE